MPEPLSISPVLRRASPLDAKMLLDAAKADGDIFAYKNVGGGRWRIEVQPTRYDAYHHPGTHGVLVLTTREVMAFTEGRYAARRTQPVHRAGDPSAR